MGAVYILDSSALQTLNELAPDDEDLTDRLIELRDDGFVLYCEAAKNERRSFAKGEPVTIWATSGWQSIRARAEVNFSSVQAVLQSFPQGGNQLSIMDVDDPDTDQQQALATVALAHQLKSAHEVVVVSDEEFTVENRCTVKDACSVLQTDHLAVKEFLEEVS